VQDYFKGMGMDENTSIYELGNDRPLLEYKGELKNVLKFEGSTNKQTLYFLLALKTKNIKLSKYLVHNIMEKNERVLFVFRNKFCLFDGASFRNFFYFGGFAVLSALSPIDQSFSIVAKNSDESLSEMKVNLTF
jgi:hypothetical protein